MSEWSCAEVAERLADHVGGRLEASDAARVRGHLDRCAECAADAELLAALLATLPEPPAGLAARVSEAVLADRRGGVRAPRFLRWGLTAAAAAAVALGSGVVWRGAASPDADTLAVVALDPVAEDWMADEAVVAGAPLFDDLTEEALQLLLEEME